MIENFKQPVASFSLGIWVWSLMLVYNCLCHDEAPPVTTTGDNCDIPEECLSHCFADVFCSCIFDATDYIAYGNWKSCVLNWKLYIDLSDANVLPKRWKFKLQHVYPRYKKNQMHWFIYFVLIKTCLDLEHVLCPI